jgi:hypothetical protein
MGIASTTLSIGDGGLGVSRQLARPPALVGCSSSGTAATVYLAASYEDAISTFGYGKLTALAAEYFGSVGGPLIMVKATSSTAGSSGSVTAVGTSTAVMTVSTATAVDDFRVKIKVVRAGADLAAVTAAVKVSLDNGTTYGEEIAVPLSGVLSLTNTGLAVTWADGTFVVNDTFAFTATAPIWDTTALGAALDALEATTYDHEFVHVAEHVTGATVGTLNTSISDLEAANTFRWWLAGTRDQSSGESVSTWQGVLLGTSPGFSAFTSRHGAICAAFAEHDDATWGCSMRRNVSWIIGPRLGLVREVSGGAGLAEHPGRVRSGALSGIDDGDLVHDFRTLTALDTGRFMGAQSLPGRGGYYATAMTRATAGSDFTSIMHVRLVKEAARLSVSVMQEFINDNVRTITGGLIDPRDADAADAYVGDRLRLDLVESGLASAVTVQVDRTNNVVATSQLNFKVRVRPLGYAALIDIDLALSTAE